MSIPFKLPDVGEGITEAEILQWQVAPGDRVTEDDTICEIETDKAVVEIPAPCNGTVKALQVATGETVAVGTVIATFDEDEAVTGSDSGAAQRPSPTPPPRQAVTDAPAAAQSPPAADAGQAPRATPSTRKLARELGVDLARVPASGPKGRVLHEDVVAFANEAPVARQVPATAIAAQPTQTRLPLKGLRKAIAEKMTLSVTTIPHATSSFRSNAEAFVALRGSLQQHLGQRISYTAMVMKAMVPALRAFPYFNASLDDQAGEIVLHGEINIGFATHTAQGLIVPVVKGVDRKPLAEVSSEIDTLAAAARERKIAVDDLQGGTVTLSNVGSHGAGHDLAAGRPIINHPQSAIIAMTRIRPQPVVADGQVVARQCLDMVTSYDHRLIDGVYAAEFMERLIAVIEEPGLLLGMS